MSRTGRRSRSAAENRGYGKSDERKARSKACRHRNKQAVHAWLRSGAGPHRDRRESILEIEHERMMRSTVMEEL